MKNFYDDEGEILLFLGRSCCIRFKINPTFQQLEKVQTMNERTDQSIDPLHQLFLAKRKKIHRENEDAEKIK